MFCLALFLILAVSSCFSPGLWGCPCGGSYDSWWSLCVLWAVWFWHPEHHPAHSEPHPCHAAPSPHPSTRGDILPAPQDGRLFPHLLQTEGSHILQGHVHGGVWCLQSEEAGWAGGTSQCLEAQQTRYCINMTWTFSEWALKWRDTENNVLSAITGLDMSMTMST